MGGMHSGRPQQHSTYIRRCLSLQIGKLRAYLVPGNVVSWVWHLGAEPSGQINIEVTSEQEIVLNYATTQDPPQVIAERVEIEAQARHLGGTQLYMKCPRCSRRASKLYLYHYRFTCRHCTGLTYQSSSLADDSRLFNTHNRYRKKLDAKADDLSPGRLPSKPKGMHWRTYWKTCKKAQDAETARWEVLGPRIEKYLEQIRGSLDGVERRL